MSNLWVTAAQHQLTAREELSDEAIQRRRERIEEHLDRHIDRGRQYYHIPGKWGPNASASHIHQLIYKHDGPRRDEHWEHLSDDVVSLRQPIYEHQGYVYPETVKQKIHEYHSDDGNFDYGGDPQFPIGGNDPKFVRHEGTHYLLDGHHRYAMARLMGHDSMWGKVFDTANPDHKQSNCYECHQETADWDHDPDDCETCHQHGWS